MTVQEIASLFGVVAVISSFMVLAEDYIRRAVVWSAVESFFLAGFMGVYAWASRSLETAALAALTLVVRGVIVPEILVKDIKRERVWEHRELTATSRRAVVWGLVVSLVAVVAMRPLEVKVGRVLSLPVIMLTVSMLTIILRENAIAQLVGYVGVENSVLYAGVSLGVKTPLLLEVGALMDVIGAVLLGVILSAEKRYGPLEVEELVG
ncbi:MAG: hydrogenase [Methanopyri archaeon]|nr:hydrogenase [Methanopyri archaeon]